MRDLKLIDRYGLSWYAVHAATVFDTTPYRSGMLT
jgi:hypothetical protein